MSNIIYTPEHIKDPRNHARRIYFSCHEGDFCLFEQIERDIRDIEKDCVIAHFNFAEEHTNEHLSEVADFHLIIVPITEKWFDDGIHREEFDFILKNRKAVLPILFESESETKFNETTENMQFLRINDKDYGEKLKRSLKDILISKELIDDVRNIFTHKMFVGYCREDFEHTQELIRCIHGEESGRRIAIWYDKYLPTGKNFEDSIFKELDDSNVVGITTTPSLISRKNYVKDKEYPHAKENDKKVVFFELLETKGEDVRNYFEIKDNDSFEMVKVRRGHKFSKYISELFGLKDAKNKQNMEQQEADRLLGHAYLNGLFVEFDNEYAVKKFEAAAKGGSIDAAHQLGNMYYHGIGVARNVKLAIYWYKEEVRLAEKNYRDIFEKMIALKKFPLVTRDITTRKLETADEETIALLTEMINIFCSAADDIISRVCRCASILRDEGYFSEATKYYRKALDIVDEADGNVSKLGVGAKHRTRIENEYNLLLMLNGENNPDLLKKNWEAILLRQKVDPENTEIAASAVKSGRNYGFALMLAEKYEEAKAVFDIAIAIGSNRGVDRNIDEIMILLHRDMGRCYYLSPYNNEEERKRNADEALKWLRSELWLLEDHEFDMEDNPYLYSSFVWNKVYTGNAYSHKDDHAEAWKSYISAIDEAEKYEKRLGDRIYTADFPIIILQLYSVIFSHISDFTGIAPELKKFLCEKIKAVLERYGDLEYKGNHKEKTDAFIATLNEALKEFSE